MEIKDKVTVLIKAGRTASNYSEYQECYTEITGKEYKNKCSNCAAKFLYRFLQNWLKTQ